MKLEEKKRTQEYHKKLKIESKIRDKLQLGITSLLSDQ